MTRCLHNRKTLLMTLIGDIGLYNISPSKDAIRSNRQRVHALYTVFASEHSGAREGDACLRVHTDTDTDTWLLWGIWDQMTARTN